MSHHEPVSEVVLTRALLEEVLEAQRHTRHREERILSKLDEVNAQVDRTIADEHRLEGIVAAQGQTLTTQAAQIHDLADEVAALKAGSVTDDQLQAISDKLHGGADEMEAAADAASAGQTPTTDPGPAPDPTPASNGTDSANAAQAAGTSTAQ